MKAISKQDIEYFIDDFQSNSKIELVEGKEKKELQRVSEAKGMKIKGSRDLAIFKTVYAFTDKPNKNGAILPQDELLKVLPQIVGKPISVNHNRKLVVGHYIDYRYIQKEKKIVAFGVFYKSNFGELWNKAQKLFKKGKLYSSFEIWSPDKAKKTFMDGTYELHQMEIAGGALVYGDVEEPAFEGADVLEMAKALKEEIPQLVYASKHKENEIIKANFWKESIEHNVEKIAQEKEENKQVTPEVQIEETPPVVEIAKIKCSNCEEQFEKPEGTSIKCPKCFCVMDSQGTMIYPPQIQDFRVICPTCKLGSWLITANREKESDLRCQGCAKEYTVKFKTQEKNDMIDRIKFLYVSNVSCYQCGTSNMVTGLSTYTQHEITCKKCGLNFPVDTAKIDKNRTIESIVIKSSEERRTKEVENETKKVEENKIEEPKKIVEENKTEEVTPKVGEKTEEIVKSSVEDEKIQTKNTDIPIASEESNQTPPEEVQSQENMTKESKDEITVETPETKEETVEVIDIDEDVEDWLEQAKKITSKERNALSDSEFAVITTVKSKKGKVRKIRMFSIHDKAHVRNALFQLPQATMTLEKMKVNPRLVLAKILKKAKELGMKELLKKRKLEKAQIQRMKKLSLTLRKAVEKISNLKKAKKLEIASMTADADKSKQDEIAKINNEADEKIKFYQANAKTIVERQLELGKDYSESLSDKDIVNDEIFTRVKLEKENVQLRADAEESSDIVSAKVGRDDDYYVKARKEIDNKAFGHIQK